MWLWINTQMEEGAHDDAIDYLRWTGVNTSPLTQPRPTRTTILKGQRTTWATPTAKAVTTQHSWMLCLSLTIHLCPCSYNTLLFAVGPTQVSSTTSSACLLLTSHQRKRSLQIWLELKWSAPSQLMSPGNPPTITASVRCYLFTFACALCTQARNFGLWRTAWMYTSQTTAQLLLIVNLNSFFYPASLCQSQLPYTLRLKIFNVSKSMPSLLTLVF